jgi:Flp pilus assembly protein TadB
MSWITLLGALVVVIAVDPVVARLCRITRPPTTLDTGAAMRVGRWRRAVVREAPPDDRDVAAWCTDVARHLRGGDALATALTSARAAPALTAALGPVVLALRRGAPVHDAVTVAGVGPGGAALSLAYAVVRACATVGGPASDAMERTAAVLRDRAVARDERAAHAAQGRLSAAVLTVLPGGAFLAMLVASGSVRSAVITPVGLGVAVAGVGLNGFGWWWMRRIVRGGER